MHVVQLAIRGHVPVHELFRFPARFLPQPVAQVTHDGQPHGVLVFQADGQVPVPLVHIHEQHVAHAHVDADPVLREARFCAGIFPALNHHQVAEPLGVIAAVGMNRRLVIHIGGDGGERGVGDFEVRLLGLAVLPLVMVRHYFLVIRVNLSDEGDQFLKLVGIQHVEARFPHGGVQLHAVPFQQRFLAGAERVKVADNVGHCGEVFRICFGTRLGLGPETGRELAIRGRGARKVNHVFVKGVNVVLGQLALPKFEEEAAVVVPFTDAIGDCEHVRIAIDNKVNLRGSHKLVLVFFHIFIRNIFPDVIYVNVALFFMLDNHRRLVYNNILILKNNSNSLAVSKQCILLFLLLNCKSIFRNKIQHL